GHRIEEEALRLTGIQQRQDVRMLEPRQDANLSRKPVRTEGGGQLRTQHFHRELAIVLEVRRDVDRGHAAGAALALDEISVGEGVAQSVEFFCHGRNCNPYGSGGRTAVKMPWLFGRLIRLMSACV